MRGRTYKFSSLSHSNPTQKSKIRMNGEKQIFSSRENQIFHYFFVEAFIQRESREAEAWGEGVTKSHPSPGCSKDCPAF